MGLYLSTRSQSQYWFICSKRRFRSRMVRYSSWKLAVDSQIHLVLRKISSQALPWQSRKSWNPSVRQYWANELIESWSCWSTYNTKTWVAAIYLHSGALSQSNRLSVSATFSFHRSKICTGNFIAWIIPILMYPRRYFVTELLGTDLHRLLTSRPLEKQFIQYFLYQILVSRLTDSRRLLLLLTHSPSARIEICTFCRCRSSGPGASFLISFYII